MEHDPSMRNTFSPERFTRPRETSYVRGISPKQVNVEGSKHRSRLDPGANYVVCTFGTHGGYIAADLTRICIALSPSAPSAHLYLSSCSPWPSLPRPLQEINHLAVTVVRYKHDEVNEPNLGLSNRTSPRTKSIRCEGLRQTNLCQTPNQDAGFDGFHHPETTLYNHRFSQSSLLPKNIHDLSSLCMRFSLANRLADSGGLYQTLHHFRQLSLIPLPLPLPTIINPTCRKMFPLQTNRFARYAIHNYKE